MSPLVGVPEQPPTSFVSRITPPSQPVVRPNAEIEEGEITEGCDASSRASSPVNEGGEQDMELSSVSDDESWRGSPFVPFPDPPLWTIPSLFSCVQKLFNSQMLTLFFGTILSGLGGPSGAYPWLAYMWIKEEKNFTIRHFYSHFLTCRLIRTTGLIAAGLNNVLLDVRLFVPEALPVTAPVAALSELGIRCPIAFLFLFKEWALRSLQFTTRKSAEEHLCDILTVLRYGLAILAKMMYHFGT
ncbi:hypothetical protein B0H11DRAFT_2227189 [Mycena galericulata]|nr:hypothetical protein B0H11DRAFT_2227189 [Mycena galericulata]